MLQFRNWPVTMLPYIQKPCPDIPDTALNSRIPSWTLHFWIRLFYPHRMDIYSLQQSQLLAQILMLLDSSFVLCSCSSPIRFHDTICRFDATTQKIRSKKQVAQFSRLKCWMLCGIRTKKKSCPQCLHYVFQSSFRILLANFYETKVVDPYMF